MLPLRVSEIFNSSGILVLAVESINFQRNKTNASCWLHGRIEPMAVIVYGPDEVYALDMDAKAIALDQLLQDTPELDAMIEPFNNKLSTNM